jgi:cyanate permease
MKNVNCRFKKRSTVWYLLAGSLLISSVACGQGIYLPSLITSDQPVSVGVSLLGDFYTINVCAVHPVKLTVAVPFTNPQSIKVTGLHQPAHFSLNQQARTLSLELAPGQYEFALQR